MKQGILKVITIKEIHVHNQVRTSFDEHTLMELTESVHVHGVLTPIVLNEVKGKYHLVCGERRYRAQNNVIKGFTSLRGEKVAPSPSRTGIPAQIYKDLTDDEILDMQIIENLQRDDPHPMQEAAAYKKMMASRKWGIKEVAARVGRSDKYVGLRVKLNNLIPEWQKVFYEDRISMRAAVELSKLAPEGQTEIYKEKGKHKDININEHTIDNQKRTLQKAPFDMKDPELIKVVGPCTTCPHNSASNVLLFPEESGNQMCMNKKCFDLKCDVSFTNKFKEAKEDPKTIFVKDGYQYQDSDQVKKVLKGGDKVLTTYQYEKVSNPSKKDIDTGKVHKAFCVQGDAMGRTFYVKIHKTKVSSDGPAPGTAAAFKEKLSDSKASAADIDNEIKRIQETEKRKKQIDRTEAGPKIYNILEENKKFLYNTAELSTVEKAMMIIMLDEELSCASADWNLDDVLKAEGFKGNVYDKKFLDWMLANPKKLDSIINSMSRVFFYEKTSGNASDAEGVAFEGVIKQYDALALKAIQDEVAAATKIREDRIAKTIATLQQKKKDLTSKPKGKGLAALLTDVKKKK